MFEFLKKKISSWIKPKEKTTKKVKSKSDKVKEKKKREKKSKIPEHLTLQEKEDLKKAEKILEETEKPLQSPSLETEEIEEERGNFFTKLIKKITSSKLTQEQFDESFRDLEIILLENNVALEAVDSIKKSLSNQLINQQIRKTEAQARIIESLKEAILSLLQEPPSIIENIKKHCKNSLSSPYVIIFFGINGTGKTTSIAKIANLLKKNNLSCVLAAADTFRAASIEQLQVHADKLKVPIIKSQYNADPASIAFDSIAYARKHNIQVVLIDTAGRMYTKTNLMKEMEKIIRISKPNLKLFVGESITGNDAIEQAKTFNETIGIDGIILSKADIDEKAGAILSVSHITKKPIYFLGTGQSYDDLIPFTKKTILKNLGL